MKRGESEVATNPDMISMMLRFKYNIPQSYRYPFRFNGMNQRLVIMLRCCRPPSNFVGIACPEPRVEAKVGRLFQSRCLGLTLHEATARAVLQT